MPRRDVRGAIVDAAEALAVEKGFNGVTTKEVAKAAECSEGSIYNHFSDRSDLLAHVVANRMLAVMGELADQPGEIGSDGSLVPLLTRVSGAYAELIALSTSLFADPEVLGRFNAVLEERGATPDGIRAVVAEQLLRAQETGRIRADVEAGAIALLLTGTCHEAALHRYLGGHGAAIPTADIAALAATLQLLLVPAG